MKKLIFIYNAKSSFFCKITEALHKYMSPKTYKCNLCMLTYGLVLEKKEWGEFIESLNIKTEFLHIDEFEKKYKSFKTTYPVVLKEENENLSVFLITEEINSSTTLKELIEKVKQKLSKK